MIGDLLVTFNAQKPGWYQRNNLPWEMVKVCGSSQVWISKPDSVWNGFPCTTLEDEYWQIWCLGEFFGTQPQISLIQSRPEELNGNFIILAYEFQLDRWHVITNRLGTLHAYYARKGSKTAFGTFSPAVASATGCNELDWGSIAGFFKFGFFLNTDTYWRDVNVFKPAIHEILDKYGHVVSTRKYWQWCYEPDQKLTYTSAIDNFKQIFERVLTDQVTGHRVAVPLSGGLDSRCTLAELGTPGWKGAEDLYLYSYGYTEESVETKIARQLVKQKNMEIETRTIAPYLFTRIHQITPIIEGFQDITQSRSAFVTEDLNQHSDHVIAAHWGDVWFDDMGFLESPLHSDRQLTDVLYQKYAKKKIEGIFPLFSDYLPADRETEIQQKLASSLGDVAEINNFDFKIKAWKTQQWSFRWTLASLRMYQAGAFPLLPFYDNRIVDFFCRIPGPFVKDRLLQIDYLKKYSPDLAKVKWQVFDANLYMYHLFNSWLLPKRAIKKARRILANEKAIQRNWEVQFLNPEGRNGLSNWLLEKGLKLHNYVPRIELINIIDEFYISKAPNEAYILSMLLTFSTWLEKYG